MGVVIDYGGGLVKSHDFYFVHFMNILQDICSKLAMQIRIIISLHNQPKILRKSCISRIFSEKLIFAHFHVYFQYTSKFARAH